MCTRLRWSGVRRIGFLAAFALAVTASAAADLTFYGSHAPIPTPNEWGLLKFDAPLSGATTRVGAGGLMFDFDFSPSGVLFSSDGSHLSTVDLTTGEQTRIGTYDDNGIISGLAFAPDGTLYGIRQNYLVTIDTATAHVTLIDATDNVIFSIDFAPDGTLYGAGGSGVYTIDPTTAHHTGTVIDEPPFVFNGLDYGADGVLRAVGLQASPTTHGELHEIDIVNGTTSIVGTTTESKMYGLASVPEPATGGLLLVGLGLLVGRRAAR